MPLRFGLFLPPFAELAEPSRVVELARSAEKSGWDGFFLWDHIMALPGMAVADPWVTIAAIGVGLGDDGVGEFRSFGGEPTDPGQRGLILDESLELLRRFWSGEDVHWEGRHFSVECAPFLPRPAQDPLPVWVACRWPHRRPLARAARHQGCFPLLDHGGWEIPAFPDPAAVSAVRSQLIGHGAPADIDIVCRGAFAAVGADERAEGLAALETAGLTWWLESFGPVEPS